MVKVKVSEGILEGTVETYENGIYYSFKGIPYAVPPLGNLRFKAPLPPTPWEGVRSAKEYGPMCYQFNRIKQLTYGSEDCLYLNIYTPQLKPDHLLPVMFWIHGGMFQFGSGSGGPEHLMRKGVIVATISYRLEIIGFLCLNTKEIPGNAGMKDQVQALKWVNKNISNFGGDPNNVTIFGVSAGARCVSYHTISPLSKGLFKRAICQSGVSLGVWSQTDQPRERALAFARSLGFYSENDLDLYNFFINQPIESLTQAKAPIYLLEKEFPPDIYFTIADEKDIGGDERFFYGDMIKAVGSNIHEGIDIMTGFTTDEGLIFLGTTERCDRTLELIKDYSELLASSEFQLNLPIGTQLEIGKKMKKHYFNNQDSKHDRQNLVKFLSMDLWVFNIIRWAKICVTKKKNTLYMYRFSYKSERNFAERVNNLRELAGTTMVTCHSDDLFYIFEYKLEVETKPFTLVLIDRFTTLWTNFAKYGNPTPDNSLGVVWQPYTIEKQDFMEIGNELSVGRAPFGEEVHFWENIYKEYGQRLFE